MAEGCVATSITEPLSFSVVMNSMDSGSLLETAGVGTVAVAAPSSGRDAKFGNGERGSSRGTFTRGGSTLTNEEASVSMLGTRLFSELPAMVKSRFRLDFLSSRGTLRLDEVEPEAEETEVRSAGIDGEDGRVSLSGNGEGGGTSRSPKLIAAVAVSVPLNGGGVAKSVSRSASSSVRTLPEILRDGPRESITAFSVMRFVAVCRGIRSSNLTLKCQLDGISVRRPVSPMSDSRNQCALGNLESRLAKLSFSLSFPSGCVVSGVVFGLTQASNRGVRAKVRMGVGTIS